MNYIFDIDGTLMDINHRRHFVEGETKDWKSFVDNIKYDIPNDLVANVLSDLNTYNNAIFFLTGRSEAQRDITINQIEIDEQLAVFGFSPEGIDYNSPDGQRVHFILLILDTHEESTLHRKLINRFQHFINDFNYRTKVLECDSINILSDLINTWEEEYLLNEDF